MTDVDKLKEEELRALSEEEEIFDLESLITDGTNAKVPITIQYYNTDLQRNVKAGAMIRPLSNLEWNNSVRLNRSQNSNTTDNIELLKKALYTIDGKPFNPKAIESMPAGVVEQLVEKVAEISGIDLEKNIERAMKLQGFL